MLHLPSSLRSWILAAVVVAPLFATAPRLAEGTAGAEEIIDKVQLAFDKTRSVKAGFTQVLESKGFGITGEYSGTVYILKPSKMLWRYAEPKGRALISDGSKLWLYDPEDKTAYHDEVKGYLHEKSPALFLAGEKTLRDIFTIGLVEPGKTDKLGEVVRLKLTPKSPQAGVKGFLLTVDGKNFGLVELLMVDHLGNRNKITFHDVERGVEIDPSIFNFTPPDGVSARPMKKLPAEGGQ